MEFDKTIITIISVVIVIAIGTFTILQLDSSDDRPEYVKGITVYVNAEGTDATTIRGAIYNADGHMIASTPEKEIIENSWNVMYFASDILVDTRDTTYILAIQSDGDISVPATGNDFITENATYGTFPAMLNDTISTDTLSIYAIYR